MKQKILLGTVMALAFASCTQEEVLNNDYGTKTLKVSVEETIQSRVGFKDAQDAQFFWTKGDQIGVTTTSSATTFQGMTLQGNGGEATGTFSGTFNGSASGYAVYPYGTFGRHSVTSEGALTYTLPAEYTYTTLDSEYAKSDGNSHNAPMWGKIENGAVTFKHLGGVIAFCVNNLPESTSDLKFVLTATNQISGSFSATLTNGEPMIVAGTSNVADKDKTVTINFSTAEGQTSGYFYVPVPTGTLGNLTMLVLNGTTEVATGAWNNISITRKDIKRANIGSQSIVGGDGEIKQVASVKNVSEALSTSENTLTVQVSDEVDEEATITIPADLSTTTTTLYFASVGENASITINEATSGSYTGKIVIEVPVGETIPTVTASVPNGTVYIKQGTVTTLVATTAENTIIIGANATVGTLTVVKGNVRIEDGGSVTTINRGTDNSDEKTYVIYEGTLPSGDNSDASIVYMSAAEWDLRQVLKNGGDYVLTSDIDLALTTGGFLTIASGKSVTIDLNGKTLTTSSTSGDNYPDDITVEGTLTVKNGTIKTANTAFYTNGGSLTLTDCRVETSHAGGATAVSVTNKGTLNISGGSYTGVKVDSQYDKYVIGVKGGATASISNATVSGGNGGVTVLGGSTATLTGGSYTGVKACGLYVSGNSTVTYSNCTFSGVEGDVVALNGTVNGVSYAEYTKMQQVSTVDELKTAITNGGSVILASDIDLDLTTGGFLTIESGKSVSIDLNGKALTTSSTSGDNYPDDITVKGTLTVKNGTINTANTAFYTDGGNLTLTDCHVKTSHAGGATAVSVTNKGTLSISGGSYTGVKVDSQYDKYVIGVKGGSTANINTTVSGGNGGVTVLGGSTATLTGGSYSGVKACGLFVNQSTVTYNNCTFSGVEGAVVVGTSGGTVNNTNYSGYAKVQ